MAAPTTKLLPTPRPTSAQLIQTPRPVGATMQPTPRPQSPVASTAPTPAPATPAAPAQSWKPTNFLPPQSSPVSARPPSWKQSADPGYQRQRTSELYQKGMSATQANQQGAADARAVASKWNSAPPVNPAALVNPSGAKISGIAAPDQQTGPGPKINRLTGKPMQVGSIGSGYTAPAVAKTTSAPASAKAATPAAAPVKPAVTTAATAKTVIPAAAPAWKTTNYQPTKPPTSPVSAQPGYSPPVSSTTTATTAGTSLTSTPSTPTARPNNPLSKRLASTVQSARSILPVAQAIAAPVASAVKGAAKAAWKSLPAIASAAKRSMPAANAATQRAAAVSMPPKRTAAPAERVSMSAPGQTVADSQQAKDLAARSAKTKATIAAERAEADQEDSVPEYLRGTGAGWLLRKLQKPVL